jgi:lysozyme
MHPGMGTPAAPLSVRTYSAAGVASAQVIDVSNWQGAFNWPAAKAATPDLAAGIYRLTQGLGGPGTASPDPDAAHNHAAIRDAGLFRGAYHFLDPTLSGAGQAQYFVDAQETLGFTQSDMLWLDNETHGQSGSVVASCAQAFMKELKTLRPNNPMGVYTYINFAQTGNDSGLGEWPLWLAYPNASAPTPPPPWTKWAFWQWGTRPESGAQVDADAFNGTVADLGAWIASYSAAPTSYVSDGTKTLAAISSAVGIVSSSLLRHTATHYGAFDAPTSDFLNREFAASTNLVDKGATLWLGN